MRKPRGFVGVIMLMFGVISLTRIIGTPRLAALHGSDILQLIASGALFGVGFAVLFRGFRFRGE